jgi:hypothetical protein
LARGGAALPLPVAAQISNHQSLVALGFWCSPEEHQVTPFFSSLSSAHKKESAMLSGQRVHTCLEALYQRRTLARDVFLLVVFVFCVAALWTEQYSATAIVALTPQSSSSVDRPRPSALGLVQSALTDERLGAIIEKLQLHPKMVQTREEPDVIRSMRSRISLGAVTPGQHASDAVGVSYLSQDRPMAIKVANALAQSVAEVKASAADVLPAGVTGKIEQQLKDSQSELKTFAAHKPSSSRPLEKSFALSDKLQAQLQEDANKLSFLEQQREHGVDGAGIRRQEERIRAAQALLEKEVQRNSGDIERLSKKFARSSGYTRAYALELDRFHALQRAQSTVNVYQDKLSEPVLPQFTVVRAATTVQASAGPISLVYSLASVLVGVFAAALAVLIAQRFKRPARAEIAVRDEFEVEELVGQYRHSVR